MFLSVNSAIFETRVGCYVTLLFGVISSLLLSLLFMFFLLFISQTVSIVVFSVWTSRGQWWAQHCLVFLEAPRVWAQSCWTTTNWSQANWSASWLTWTTDVLPSDTRTTSVDTMFFTKGGRVGLELKVNKRTMKIHQSKTWRVIWIFSSSFVFLIFQIRLKKSRLFLYMNIYIFYIE